MGHSAAQMSAIAAEQIARVERALASHGTREYPVAVLDLDFFDANAADLARRAGGTPIRVASKSLRVRALLERALEHTGFRGILAYTLPEALWLASTGYHDIVVAYPTVDRSALRRLAEDPAARRAITVMVDETAHLDLIADATTGVHLGGTPIRVALELDASFAPVPSVRFGAHRSPMHAPEQVSRLAREASARRGLRVVGLMAYEGQIAGVTDSARTPYGAAVRAMKSLSSREIATRRGETVRAVQEVAELEFVNAGGTGSIESSVAEDVVTEVAAGSGLIGPGLFDNYVGFAPLPALLLGFTVVRRPAPRVATLLGGGWIASGVPAADRLPTLWYPRGLTYAPQEGAGEVQTPVIGDAAEGLRIGDMVWLRHAKSGEPAEHATVYHLLQGEHITDVTPTYRGEGRMFL